MGKYVRDGDGRWHWCRNCDKWPSEVEEQKDERPNWDLCNECLSKERRKDCTSK